jgi:ABC-2 type transport system ATP-binding protein
MAGRAGIPVIRVIHVDDLRKNYRDVAAVRGLSFDVPPGQILGLVGPNGAGKTTTMRVIAGIIPPSGGVIEVAGHDVGKAPLQAKKALAYVPDDPALFGSLTVQEHLVLAARAYEVTDYRPRAEALLRRFQIYDKRDTLAQELSRGGRQKTAICAAYIQKARAFLFDEPLTGLDPHGIRTMKESIREGAAAGAAFVISSHLLSLIEDLCTHLLVLNKGQALFMGRVADARALASGGERAATLEESFFHIVRDAVES